MRVLPALALLAAAPCLLAATAADVGNQLQHIALDPNSCYRVLDLNIAKEDLKVYLDSGYLIFAKPIAGARLAAMFVVDEEAGDADLLLLPPTRSERASLAKFTGSPTLDEHFKAAALVFTDGTGDKLLAQLQDNPTAKKSPDMGSLIAGRWSSVLANLVGSFETRLVYDVLSNQPSNGLFYMAVSGNQLGNFDALYDPTAADQILLGRLNDRNNRTFFDIWTSFQARSFRNGAPPRGPHFIFDNIRIDATIASDLSMKTVTEGMVKIEEPRPSSVVPFSLSPRMKITSAVIDGKPAEIFDHESLRSNLIANRDDRQLLLVAAQPLDPSRPHQVEIHSEGAVIRNAGNNVYFVGSRGTWYPRTGRELSTYDLTFRYPKELTIAATGRQLDDRIDGDVRITHLRTDAPVRFAGFNLGNFQSATVQHNGYTIHVYANRNLETALAPHPLAPALATQQDQLPHRHQSVPPPQADAAPPAPAPVPDPTARIDALSQQVGQTLDFMTSSFGPAPVHTLSITPIPGTFGQGFPGLVYLSTLAYLKPDELPPALRQASQETEISYLLEAHEVAHQWWGNLVVPAGDRDDWLIESLANYSALLLLEHNQGRQALGAVLNLYRDHLLSKAPSGSSLESAGPIVWGSRLESSLAPDAWRTVTYEKGTWIIHMLRRRLGDEKFLALLRDIAAHDHTISTEKFRQLAGQYAPASPDPGLKMFFDNWVYGTGIPSVKLSYSWSAMKLKGTIEQRGVDKEFSAFVPVQVQTALATRVYWLAAGSDSTPFSLPLKSRPTNVSLLLNDCLITTWK